MRSKKRLECFIFEIYISVISFDQRILLYFTENILFLNALSILHPVCFLATIPINS
jgi:hypothetical protein